jgi:transposase
MQVDIFSLPNNVEELKSIIFSLHKENKIIIKDKQESEKRHELEFARLMEKYKLLTLRMYRRKSEKFTDEEIGQARLFNEIETGLHDPEQTIRVSAHTKKKGGRKPLPENLERIEIVLDIPESDKKLPDGREMIRIGEERSEQLEVTPPSFKVKVTIRPKYIHPDSVGMIDPDIRIAPMAPQILPKSMATPSLLAYLLAGKFCDALPFYRQERIFDRYGIMISRKTMCEWAMKVYQNTRVMQDLMEEELTGYDIIQMDETWLQVLNEEDRKNTQKSYMWVARGGPPGKTVLLFNYHPTRSGEFVRKYLKGWKGWLQCDGYAGYESGTSEYQGITLTGCMAHARRKFVEAWETASKTGSAEEAIELIRKLYQIESEAKEKDLSVEELRKIRQEKSDPVLKEFKAWLNRKSVELPPKTALGSAVLYALGEWTKLTHYIDDGRLNIDNNLTENGIRSFVMGRKNWLFSGCPEGAEASAFYFSLIETAKANGLEPYWYIFYLFEKFPLCKGEKDYRALLPYNLKNRTIAEYFMPMLEKF